MRLVITADDLGYSADRDDAILAAFRGGGITRSSLLVNGMSAKTGLMKACNAGLPVGLHLNLTEGLPLTGESTLTTASLLQPGLQVMRGKMGFRDALVAGAIKEDDLVREVRAQLSHFFALHPEGCRPSHLDGHQHIHVLPEVARVIARVLSEFPGLAGVNIRIPTNRLPSGRVLESLTSLQSRERISFYKSVAKDAEIARTEVFAPAGFRVFTGFFGFTTMGADMSVEGLKRILEAYTANNRPPGDVSPPHVEGEKVVEAQDVEVMEWMVHPGRVLPPAATESSAGCGEGPDDFSLSPERDHESSLLVTKELRELREGMEGMVISPEAHYLDVASPYR